MQKPRKVLTRERPVNIGIRPSANSIKMKRVVRLKTSVCFRITRLMNNQIKSRKGATSQKRRESDDKNAVAIVKSVSQLVVYHKIQMHSFLKVESLGGNPMQKVLEPIQRVRFAKSTLRHASLREKKGTIVGKNKCQSSSSAKFLLCEI